MKKATFLMVCLSFSCVFAAKGKSDNTIINTTEDTIENTTANNTTNLNQQQRQPSDPEQGRSVFEESEEQVGPSVFESNDAQSAELAGEQKPLRQEKREFLGKRSPEKAGLFSKLQKMLNCCSKKNRNNLNSDECLSVEKCPIEEEVNQNSDIETVSATLNRVNQNPHIETARAVLDRHKCKTFAQLKEQIEELKQTCEELSEAFDEELIKRNDMDTEK